MLSLTVHCVFFIALSDCFSLYFMLLSKILCDLQQFSLLASHNLPHLSGWRGDDFNIFGKSFSQSVSQQQLFSIN